VNPHPTWHLAAALALVFASIGFTAAVRNRIIRRRLLFSTLLGLAATAIHIASLEWPESPLLHGTGDLQRGRTLEWLAMVMGVAGGTIALLFNRWGADREADRTPAIVQDFLLIAVGIWATVVVFRVNEFGFITGSAIVAAILGFAAQDTLGNAFSGIALQMERPFRVGHWVSVDQWVGMVSEVTWRATKIRTKAGNLVTIPNSVIASHGIINYSEPIAPTRLELEIGVTYNAFPNDVRAALLSATRSVDLVLETPKADVLLVDFGSSAVIYRVRFWISDFARDTEVLDAVRTRIYYELRRRGMEIPFPMQIEYSREDPVVDPVEQKRRFTAEIAVVPVFTRLPADAHAALAESAREAVFADGDTIVRQGDAGGSMFIVVSGAVAVAIGPERREVAVTRAGGYFGEMSLLTGEPRTASVIARGDTTVVEIAGDAFRAYVQSRPEVIDQLAAAALTRRHELDDARAASGSAPHAERMSLAAKMREFFGLD
jgi:small-conductance mechanosensitive channel/CRP-like cAMP-binding protein